jgi:hypothetical protein
MSNYEMQRQVEMASDRTIQTNVFKPPQLARDKIGKSYMQQIHEQLAAAKGWDGAEYDAWLGRCADEIYDKACQVNGELWNWSALQSFTDRQLAENFFLDYCEVPRVKKRFMEAVDPQLLEQEIATRICSRFKKAVWYWDSENKDGEVYYSEELQPVGACGADQYVDYFKVDPEVLEQETQEMLEGLEEGDNPDDYEWNAWQQAERLKWLDFARWQQLVDVSVVKLFESYGKPRLAITCERDVPRRLLNEWVATLGFEPDQQKVFPL